MLDILIPVLKRPHRVEPLLASIAETTDVPHRVLFLCSTGDRAQIAAVKAAGADYLTLKAPVANGQYAKKINQGFRETDGDMLFLGADDLSFRSGWATIASGFPQSVVSVNDLGNYFVRQGLLSTHSLIRRSYIEVYGASLDGPGVVYHEGYWHNFVDCELSVLARQRKEFAYARRAVAEHLHPGLGRAPHDEIYEVGSSRFTEDRSLFIERMADYRSDRLVKRFSGRRPATDQSPLEQTAMISVCIASYGSADWQSLAWSRAWPSAISQEPHEVIVEYQPFGDVASSRNAAAAKATGDWLCFLDADDELGAGFIEAMQIYADLHSSERVLLTPRVMQVIKGRRKRPKFWKKADITSCNWITISTLVQRELFEEVGGFRLFAHGLEDWNLWSRCVRAGASVRQVYGAVYIAHYNYDSAHHQLSRDKEAYMRQYELAREDAWG